MMLDQLVFDAAAKARVEKVVFASSGCVYRTGCRRIPRRPSYLREDMVGPPYDADNMYGWAKLMGEMTLRAYRQGPRDEGGLVPVLHRLRQSRAREPRGHRDDRARVPESRTPSTSGERRADPELDATSRTSPRAPSAPPRASTDGTGDQPRHDGAHARDRRRPRVLAYTGHKAEIRFLLDKPVGPMNRVADNALAKKLLKWEPRIKFVDGLHQTIDWYFASRIVRRSAPISSGS
jgi:hypothetical protein